jgi:nucleoid DNA-binding protein|tara:strand:+ start:2585 stop:2818 length:234 start_codon:yes stop_codon:yes gene_type:complete
VAKHTKLRQIIAEIAHDLGIDKKLVKRILIAVFREVGFAIILRGRPVMFRKFLKIVFAIRAGKKTHEMFNKYETRKK